MTTTNELDIATKVADTRKAIEKWQSEVQVSLSDDYKNYMVEGDERIDSNLHLPRVTQINGVLEQKGLRYVAMNAALDYVEEHIGETSVEALIEGARGESERRRDGAANFGSRAHALLNFLARDPNYKVDPEFDEVVRGWEKFKTEMNLEILATEIPLYCHDTNGSVPITFAGTADLLGMDGDGNFVIVDYKTGSGLRATDALQQVAYSLALAYCGIGNFMDARDAVSMRAFVVRFPSELCEDPCTVHKKPKDCETEFDPKVHIKEVKEVVTQQEFFVATAKMRAWKSGRSNKWVRRSNR